MRFSAQSLLLLIISSSELVKNTDAFSATRSTSHRVASTQCHMANADHSVFLTPESAVKCIQVAEGTPLYAYSLKKLKENADACLAFPNAYGLTVRYAMKACPNGTILKYFNQRGIHIDASSGYEVRDQRDCLHLFTAHLYYSEISNGCNIFHFKKIQVRRAMANGVPPENISLSSQELPHDFDQLVDMGVKINAW